jgi:hypothetical protein
MLEGLDLILLLGESAVGKVRLPHSKASGDTDIGTRARWSSDSSRFALLLELERKLWLMNYSRINSMITESRLSAQPS